jgi:anti-sigma B factor antagonist
MRENGAPRFTDHRRRPEAGASSGSDVHAVQAERPAFALIERQEASTHVIAVQGELDLETAPKLKWALTDVLKAGCPQLVVDLSLVTFIDSTALGVLVGVHRSLPAGGRLAIVCTSNEVLNIFELTGLEATFDIFATLDDALAFARGSAAATG